MQQISNNLIVLSPGDPFEEAYGDYLKIFLTGTLDLVGGKSKIPWQQKFINGLMKLMGSDTTPQEGLPENLGEMKFLIMNPLTPTEGAPSLENPQFVQKMTWELQCYQMADAIVANYMKKSTSASSLQGTLLNASSGKLVVRCPQECIFHGTLKMISQTFGFPVLGDSSTLLDIVKTIFQTNPKFMELMNYGMDE